MHYKPVISRCTVFYLLILLYFIKVGSFTTAAQEYISPQRFQKQDIDTNAIINMLTEANVLIETHSQRAPGMLDSAYEKCSAIGFNDGIVYVLMLKSTYLSTKGEYSNSMAQLQKAWFHVKQGIYRKRLIPGLHLATAQLYYYSHNMPLALKYGMMTLQELEKQKIKDPLLYSNTYLLLNTIYTYEQDSVQALFFFNKAETSLKELKDNKKALPALYNNKAISYLTSYRESYGTNNLPNSGKDNPSDIRLQKARFYLEKAHQLGDYIALFNLGEVYRLMQQPEQAIELYKDLPSSAIPTFYDSVSYFIHTGRAYLDAKKYTMAEYTLLTGYKMAKQGDAIKYLSVATRTLAYLYTETQNYKCALDFQNEYHDICALLADSTSINNFNKLTVQFQTAEKEKALAQSKLLLANQNMAINKKNLWLLAVSATMLIIILLTFNMHKSNKHKQHLQTERLQSIQKEQEIGNLKSMINGEEKERARLARELHDGIMVQLSSVKMILRSIPEPHKELKDTNYYEHLMFQLDKTSKELRQTAHNLMPDTLLAGGLADAVCYFCQHLPPETDLEIDFQRYGVIPRMQSEFELALYRIIQELVQNILKHAHASKATVQLSSYEEDMLNITVEDNGIGISEEKIKNNTGMGLKSMRTRVQALNGTMDLRTSEAGTNVYLEFDIRSVILPQTSNV